MIKAKEYRIGNWVSNGEVEVQLTSKDIYHLDVYVNRVIAKPIPITPEWLERMGFISHRFYLEHQNENFEITNGKDGFQYCVNGCEYVVGKPFLYVHQLQNLIFALTGEEITIKDVV